MRIKHRTLRTIVSGVGLCVLCYAPLADAATYQSHKSIYQAAKKFVRNHVASQHGQRPEIKIGKLAF